MANLERIAEIARVVRSLLIQDPVVDIGQLRGWDRVLENVALAREARAAGVDVTDSDLDRLFGLNA